MKNTSLSDQEQETAVRVYEIAKAFISSHYVADTQTQLSEMFATYTAYGSYTDMAEGDRAAASLTFKHVINLMSDLRRLIPDAEALEGMAA